MTKLPITTIINGDKCTLDKGNFGWSVTNEVKKTTFCERNMTEKDEFNRLFGHFKL